MPTSSPARPAPNEFHEYYGKYIALVPDGDVRAQLAKQIGDSAKYITSRGDAWSMSRYAPGKWTPKEVIGHVTDAERIFTYRALRIARNDKTPLAGFEEADYVPMSGADARTVADLLEEWAAVRAATVKMFNSFDETAWTRRGTASGHEVTARALAFISAGHELHHLKILRERYV